MSNHNKPFIHEKAEVQTKIIGEGTKIWQYSVALEVRAEQGLPLTIETRQVDVSA
jgi:hypothetical protein